MARTLALIAPTWPILHRVSCSCEMVPNAPKRKETHQKMSLGSNSVDWERSLRKFLIRHRGTNFCINCTSLECFASSLCSSIIVPNAPKQKETYENMSLESKCVDRECPFREILMRHCGTNSCINCTRLAHLHPVSCNSETIPNAPKRKEMHQKMSLGSNGADQERVLHQVSCSSETIPKCTRTERNTPNHEFRVQWCGSGAFLAKILRRHHGTNFCINCTSLSRFAPCFVL